MNKKKSLLGSLSLLLTALIWGTAFGAQSKGMDFVAPFTFNGFRSFIAILALGICLLIVWFRNHRNPNFRLVNNKKAIFGSLLCGLCLFFGTSIQQVGISMTSVGKAGFLSALYIILVPILGLFLKKKLSPKIWLCVVISLIGLYLLCIKENFTIELGDFLILLSTLGFAVQILIIDHISNDINPILLSIIQFGVVGILSLFPITIIEKPTIGATIQAMPYLLFAGILSSGIAYTLQTVGQKYTNPTVASLILSLESVFAAFTGLIFLNEQMALQEFIGCLFIFTAIILSQINFKNKLG